MFVTGPLGLLHGVPEGVRDHVPDPRLAGMGVGVLQGLHIERAFGDDLVEPAAVGGQIPLVHILSEHCDLRGRDPGSSGIWLDTGFSS